MASLASIPACSALQAQRLSFSVQPQTRRRCISRQGVVGARASHHESGADEKAPEEQESPFTGLTIAAPSRRQALGLVAGLGMFTAAPTLVLPTSVQPVAPQTYVADGVALAATQVQVGSYLPTAGIENFVQFTAGPKDTPALRAGNVSPYSFVLPPTWIQQRIANILSGNYCQPKCAEPWIEVKFEDPRQGVLQVVASPKVRLTNKPSATIEEIGEPEKIIAALGPFVTGDSFDPDELVESSVKKVPTADGSQTFYSYTLETPYARSGTHQVASATAKGDTVLLLVISANDSQWANHEALLRKLVDSFRV